MIAFDDNEVETDIQSKPIDKFGLFGDQHYREVIVPKRYISVNNN